VEHGLRGVNELALFAGHGLGMLGTRLLGFRPAAAVEIDPRARATLIARQDDHCLGGFPIWDDIRTFDGLPWRGAVDLVSGGFPCQPFSTAARGRNVAVDLWPEMLRVVQEVRPRYVIAENVQRQPIAGAAWDLREIGYTARIAAIDSAELAAPHRRVRWWVVADADGESEPRRAEHEEVACLCDLSGLALWEDVPASLGMDDGRPDRMDRLHGLGNGQLPLMVVAAWRLLKQPHQPVHGPNDRSAEAHRQRDVNL
jgi:DNA (cytosine-5)-methyltransferase 1